MIFTGKTVPSESKRHGQKTHGVATNSTNSFLNVARSNLTSQDSERLPGELAKERQMSFEQGRVALNTAILLGKLVRNLSDFFGASQPLGRYAPNFRDCFQIHNKNGVDMVIVKNCCLVKTKHQLSDWKLVFGLDKIKFNQLRYFKSKAKISFHREKLVHEPAMMVQFALFIIHT